MNTFIIKVYADAVIAGRRKFSTIPEKAETDVYKELENRVKAGTLTSEKFEELLES